MTATIEPEGSLYRQSRAVPRNHRASSRRSHRVAPADATMLASRSKKQLTIDTKKTEPDGRNYTPRTLPATPDSTRESDDIRSPGHQKTPKVEHPVPDLITQTDKYGRAVTPRLSTAIENARKIHPSGPKPRLHVDRQGHLSEDASNADACAETLLDTFRIMCCCLMVEDDEEDVRDTVSSSGSVERPKLLPALHPEDTGKKCLVLDLDETLVHSSFRAVPGADFVIPVQIEDVVHFVYVMKRPGVDEFLVEMAKHYEIVVYTASLNKYADPLLDLLDPNKVIRSRLFRESCVFCEGNYVKDLSLLDRDLSQSIIIDNSPSSYIFHPENAIDCSSFIDDPNDRELDQIAAFLTGIKGANDVRNIAPQWRNWPNVGIAEQ